MARKEKKKKEQKQKDMPVYEIPWPKELRAGIVPGLLWAGVVFVAILLDWRLASLAIVAMLVFFYRQRQFPVGRARTHYVRGRIAYRKHELKEALNHFYKALEMVPDASAIYPIVGDIQFGLDQLDQARSAYSQYFEMEDDDHMRVWFAGKLMERSLFAEASAELEKLPLDLKSEIQMVNLLAVCYLKSGDAKSALIILERAALRERGTGEQELTCRYLLAKAYLEVGEKGNARRILEELDHDKPGFEDVSGLLRMLENK
jgi:tetratricopeptide (TPR) repeat protein